MQVIEGTPTELTNTKPWIDYLHSITHNQEGASEFFQAYGQVIAAQVPRRLLLHGPGQLIAACEFSLDLFRSITSTISELEPGGLEDEHAKIHYHPNLHRCDHQRLTKAVERFPNDSFLVVAADWNMQGDGWMCSALNTAAGIPWPALTFLKWLHADWNLSDVSPRIDSLKRWAHRYLPQDIKLVN